MQLDAPGKHLRVGNSGFKLAYSNHAQSMSMQCDQPQSWRCHQKTVLQLGTVKFAQLAGEMAAFFRQPTTANHGQLPVGNNDLA
jgi:uncharacterized protein